MSRKRIVVALLLVVTLSLGAACYLQLNRTKGSEVVHAAAPEVPVAATDASVEQTIESAVTDEPMYFASVSETAPDEGAPSSTPPANGATSGAGNTTSTETSETSTGAPVVASSGGNEEAQLPGRYGNFRIAGRFSAGGGGGGSGAAGDSETPGPATSDTGPAPDETPSGSGPVQSPQASNNSGDSPPQNNGEGEGAGETPVEEEGGQPPLVNEPPGEPPTWYDPPREDKPVRVPEPSTLALLGASLMALGLQRRRRSAQ